MSEGRLSVVFDCNAYLQGMTSESSPATECLQHLESCQFDLWVSDAVLSELRDLPNKPGVRRFAIDQKFVERFIGALLPICRIIRTPPSAFIHPIDSKDSMYIDLAIAADAKLVVSRDKHLLNLMNPAKPWSADFRQRFPMIEIITPVELLRRLNIRSK